MHSEEIVGKANVHFVMKPKIFLLDGITGFFCCCSEKATCLRDFERSIIFYRTVDLMAQCKAAELPSQKRTR